MRRVGLGIAVAIAAITHVTYFALRYGSFYFPDSFTYLEPAKNILTGRGFVSGAPAAIETFRTPGYPVLLALFGARTVPVIVMQHLLAIALVAAVFLFVERRTGNTIAAFVASILLAIDTPTILVTNKLLTEGVFTVLLFVVFVLAVTPQSRWVVIALLLGTLVLIRPIAMFLFVVVLVGVPRRRWLPFVLVAVAFPVAWAARNWHHTGVFTVSSVGSINLLGQRAAGALAIEDGGDFHADLLDEENGLTEDADDLIQQKLHIEDAEELPTAVRAKYYGSYALRIIAKHPAAFAELTLRGILINLFDSDWEAMEVVSRLHPSLVQLLINALTAATFVLALIGLIAMWRKDRMLAAAIGLTVGYFVLISAGAEAEARFRVPVMPQIAIAAGVGFDFIRRALRAQASS